MCAPRCLQAWAWLALLGLALVDSHQQTAANATRPNSNRQKLKAKLHFVCKETEDCLAWPVRRGRDGMMRMSNATECGVVRLRQSSLQQAQMKILQSANKSLGFYCKTISFLGVNKKKRLRRQSSPRRGKFRGQTQSQYLNIGGHDNGKAEALSDADSSRALVSGKSGMGQAQSQSVYDPSCDECFGGGSDTGAENMRHGSGPRIALNNEGRFPIPGYGTVPVGSDTGRQINPNNVNLQRPGIGPSSNNGNYSPPDGPRPPGSGNSYQQPGGSIPGINNYGNPNQGSINTGIPSSNGQPNWRGGSQTPTQQENGFVNNQNIPGQTNMPGYNLQNPLNGHTPNSGNAQIPSHMPMDRNGQIPNSGQTDMNRQIPNNWQVDQNGGIPNNGNINTNGQIPNNGLLDKNAQVPSNVLMNRNGQIPYTGPVNGNGQVDRTYPQIDPNMGNRFYQRNPDGSRIPSQLNPDGSTTSLSTNPTGPNGFNQSPALYPSQYPATSYTGNSGLGMFPGQISSLPASNGNTGNISPLGNNQHPGSSVYPGSTIPTQGSLQTQNGKTLPIPYGHSTTSFIGPNGETYVCCIVAPGNKSPTNIGQAIQGQPPQPGAQGPNNYQNSQYDSTGSQGRQNNLPEQGNVGLNYLNNQPGYGNHGQEAYFPSTGGGGGTQTLPNGGSGSQGTPYYTSGGQNTYPSNVGNQGALYPSGGGQTVPATGSIYNGNQGTPYNAIGQSPQTVGRVGETQSTALNNPNQNPSNAFTGGQQSPYNLRGQDQSGAPYYNGGQGQNTYPINNQNTPFDSQRRDQIISPLGSETPYYNSGQGQNPLIGNGGPNLPHDRSPHDQSSTNAIVGSQGSPYYNQGQGNPPLNVNGQGAPYYTSGGQNIVPANDIPFTNNQGQGPPITSYGQDVRGTQVPQGNPYGSVNGAPSQGGMYSPGTQILPSQSSTGGATLDRPWNNGTPYGTGSGSLGPGQAPGQTGSQLGGQGQSYPNTIGAQYPQVGPQGTVGQTPTQEQGHNGQYGPIPGNQNMQNPSPGSYIIGNRGQETVKQGTGGLQGNIPGGQYQPYGSVPNTLVPGNQNQPGFPAQNPNNMYPGAQTTGPNSQQGPYNAGMGPDKDLMGPGYNQTSLNGMPPKVFDPNAIISEKDESEAQASITHDFNGTMAIASSKGGNEKGKANTQVQGSYTGTGSFSAQAQITDEDKGAESQVSGGKEGATSNALGKGKNNKSQANVQLGSETGSLQTQSQSENKHLSTNSQVQGGVKGGMADAQARGPGSTSSQAQIGFTPYKDGDKAHDILKTPFVGVGSASAQSNGKTGQSQSQLQGTFKYGITYNGAAQSGASVDKDAVFESRMPYKKVDVFEGEKNIEVETEIPLPLPKVDIEDNDPINDDNREIDHPHAVHHKTDEQLKNTTPKGITRSFDSHINTDKEKDYEYEPNREEISPDDYDGEGADPPEYYDEFPREPDATAQHVSAANRRNIDVQQTTRGNTQRIILGNLQGQNAEIVQKSSEQTPDYRRIYQPGERVPGTGGYIIPAGFTGSIQALSSRDRTIALGSRESPSQAQTVSLTPGNGQINYITAKPAEYGKSVNPNQLKSLHNSKPDDNRYMTVSKTVSGALDGDNKLKKEYSHTYYTKSSSCGYFTFTCTMVRGTNGTKKVCKPKIPTNPDGTPIKC